ncbi:MAG: ester cyclase [Bradymonadia bacterium]
MSESNENQAFMQGLMTAFNNHDKAQLGRFYTDDCVFIDPLNGMDGTGPKGPMFVSEMLDTYYKGSSDLRHELVDVFVAGDRIGAHFKGMGTHNGDMLGVAATGKRFEVDIYALVKLRDGRICEVKQMADVPGMWKQLGASPG